jgi:hypothetical protein
MLLRFPVEAFYPWTQGLTTRQDLHFHGIINSNMAHRWSHNLEPSVSAHLRNRIFRPSKCRRDNQREQDTPDPRLSKPFKNIRWPKCLRGRHECRRVTQRKQDTLDQRLSWSVKNNIFRWTKCLRGWHEAIYPGVEDFRKGISTNNYAVTMPKNNYHFSNF